MNRTAATKERLAAGPPQARLRLLQRKCACGNNATVNGTCDGCARKKGSLQRKPANERTVGGWPAVVHAVLETPGQPIEAATRGVMEPHFGHDFSSVRVHTDAQASASAAAVNALAYTVGNHVVFAENRYAPQTNEGKRRLAHELAHVVQQSRNRSPLADAISMPGDAAEVEADRAAAAVMRGDPVTPIHAEAAGIQRDVGWAQRGDDPWGTPESPWCESPEGRSRRRREGVIFGDTLCRAADNVAVLNGAHPSDYDFVPEERRPFIRRTGERSWVLAPPPVEIADPWELRCFISGVNDGITAYQEAEQFWGQIAEALQLLATALNASSIARMGAGAPAPRLTTQTSGGRPTLVLHQGGAPGRVPIREGRVVAPPSQAPATVSPSFGGGRASSAAPKLEPQAVAQPVTRPELRVVPDPVKQPELAAAPRNAPLPGPIVLPLPAPAPSPISEKEQRRRNCFEHNFGAAACDEPVFDGDDIRDEKVALFLMNEGYEFNDLAGCRQFGEPAPAGKIRDCNMTPAISYHCAVKRSKNVVSIFACLCCDAEGTARWQWSDPHWSDPPKK
ncbi:MAG TPA: DUF4157 domain-containing protein [Paucimonas sp.]|nr:DUF4157 domain-containing protein [Paucimonas sp.]